MALNVFAPASFFPFFKAFFAIWSPPGFSRFLLRPLGLELGRAFCEPNDSARHLPVLGRE
jgi:hypothetical protein